MWRGFMEVLERCGLGACSVVFWFAVLWFLGNAACS
jgi:hypothetical protein